MTLIQIAISLASITVLTGRGGGCSSWPAWGRCPFISETCQVSGPCPVRLTKLEAAGGSGNHHFGSVMVLGDMAITSLTAWMTLSVAVGPANR